MTTVTPVASVTEDRPHGSALCIEPTCWDCAGAKDGAAALVRGYSPHSVPGPLYQRALKETAAHALAYWIIGEVAKSAAYRRVNRVLRERAW